MAWPSGIVTAAPDFSLIVLVRFEKISPGAAVSANSSPMRAADAGTSTETGEADDARRRVGLLAGLHASTGSASELAVEEARGRRAR